MSLFRKTVAVTVISFAFVCTLCACGNSNENGKSGELSEMKRIDVDTENEISTILGQTNVEESFPVSIYTVMEKIFYNYDKKITAVDENTYNVTFSGEFKMEPDETKENRMFVNEGSITFSVDLNNKTCKKSSTEGSINNALMHLREDYSWVNSHVNIYGNK